MSGGEELSSSKGYAIPEKVTFSCGPLTIPLILVTLTKCNLSPYRTLCLLDFKNSLRSNLLETEAAMESEAEKKSCSN